MMGRAQSKDFPLPKADVVSLAYGKSSPDGSLDNLVAGYLDGIVRFWGDCLIPKNILALPSEVTKVAISHNYYWPDSDNFFIAATSARWGGVAVWHYPSCDVKLFATKQQKPMGMAWGPENTLTIGDHIGLNFARIGHVDHYLTDECLRSAYCVEYSPDKKLIAVGSGLALAIVDAEKREVINQFSTCQVMSLSWFPDNKRIAYTDVAWADEPIVRAAIVDISDRNLHADLPFDGCWYTAVSPDGKHVALSGDNGIVRIIDVCGYNELHNYKLSHKVGSLAISPSGKTVAVGLANGNIALRPLLPE